MRLERIPCDCRPVSDTGQVRRRQSVRPFNLRGHEVSNVIHSTGSKGQRKVEQTVIAKLVRSIEGRPSRRFLLIAAIAVHGAIQLDPSFDAVFGKTMYYAGNPRNSILTQFLLISFGQKG